MSILNKLRAVNIYVVKSFKIFSSAPLPSARCSVIANTGGFDVWPDVHS